jgi:hypothetical protein
MKKKNRLRKHRDRLVVLANDYLLVLENGNDEAIDNLAADIYRLLGEKRRINLRAFCERLVYEGRARQVGDLEW